MLSALLAVGVLAAGERTPLVGRIEKAAGGPTLVYATGQKPSPAVAFRTVLLEPSSVVTLAPRLPFTVHCRTGEQLAAGTFTFGAQIRLETELGTLEIPAEHVEAVARQPARPEILYEPFAQLPGTWTVVGQPRLDSQRFVSPPASLLLSQPEQRLEQRFETPIPEGTLSLRYYDDGLLYPGRRWGIALSFQGASAPLVTVHPGWDRPFVSAALDKTLPIATLPAPRRQGWRDLEIAFGPTHLMVNVDGAAVVASLGRGVAQPLVGLTLAVERAAEGAPEESATVAIDDVVVRGAEVKRARLLDDEALSSVVDAAGDQWFGALVAADQQTVQLRLAGDYAQRFDWRQLVRLETAQPEIMTSVRWAGSIGSLELASGSRLVVGLKIADAQRWVINHPLFGQRPIATRLVRSWTPWLDGGRTQLHPGPIHLGTKADFSFRRPTPQGTSLVVRFELAGSVKDVYLTVRASGMEGTGPLAPFAKSLRAGHLQTEVWVNRRKVDYLNRHLPEMPDTSADLRLPLSAEVLQSGRNELEIRLAPDPGTGAVDDIELSRLAVEQLGNPGP
jgi:hypothetical protein